jgi:hypothetical protein
MLNFSVGDLSAVTRKVKAKASTITGTTYDGWARADARLTVYGGGGRVLVQREMEKWRSPLASIPPALTGQLGEHRAKQVATGELGGG